MLRRPGAPRLPLHKAIARVVYSALLPQDARPATTYGESMTAKHAGRIFALLLAAALAGCKTTGEPKASSDQWNPPTAVNPIFVLGTIDMSEMPGYFKSATLKREWPAPKMTIHTFRVSRDEDSCVFFTEELTVGRYQLVNFTIHLPDRDLTFNLPDSPRFRADFHSAGVHYLGTFKPRELRRHGRTRYEVEIVHTHTEREAIERILPDANDDFWKNLLTERLQLLR